MKLNKYPLVQKIMREAGFVPHTELELKGFIDDMLSILENTSLDENELAKQLYIDLRELSSSSE
jgi:hypothetical protein